jgi:hypothetical protein
MSQTICANCGKSHAPQVTTQQARAAEWPTRVQDILYMMKKLGISYTGDAVTINGQRMGVPDPPEWVEPTEPAPPVVASPLTSLRTHAATPRQPELIMYIPPPEWVEPTEPVTVNEKQNHGVPDPPEWVELKDQAA